MNQQIYEELNDTANQRDILTKFVTRNSDAVTPRLRLLELAAKEKDWKLVRDQSLGLAAPGFLGRAENREQGAEVEQAQGPLHPTPFGNDQPHPATVS